MNKEYNVGSIIYSQGGYNQTNVNYYKIVKRTEKTLTIQKIGDKVVDGDPLRVYHTIPDESVLDGEPFKVWLNKYGTAAIRNSYGEERLSDWDGEPKWCNTGFNG